MDGNQEGTPNPLNPSQNATPAAEPVASEPVATEPESAPVEPVAPATTAEPVEPAAVPAASTEPVAEAPKKKKTGLIIGLIACIFIAAGCGVAAFLFFMNNNGDPVKAAISKIMGGEAPSNIVADGVIEVVPSDDSEMMSISKLSIGLKAELVPKFKANTANADIKLTMESGDEISLKVSEIYTSSGDLYIKVNGIKDIVNQMLAPTTLQTNCLEDGDVKSNCMTTVEPVLECVDQIDCETTDIDSQDSLGAISGIIELLDGEWLKLSQSALEELTGDMTSDEGPACMISFVEDLGSYGKTMAEIYNSNPFVTSTTENLKVASKQNPIYKLGVDNEKLEGFVTGVQTTKPFTNLFDCMGYDEAEIDFDSLTEEFDGVPNLYVEIDGNKDFTRLYMDGVSSEGEASYKADFNFSYPSSINITEPAEYKDFMNVMQNLMQDDSAF